MPTKLLLSPVPGDLQAAHRQFEHWRHTRQAGARIPAPLWAAAVAVARRSGVYWERPPAGVGRVGGGGGSGVVPLPGGVL